MQKSWIIDKNLYRNAKKLDNRQKSLQECKKVR